MPSPIRLLSNSYLPLLFSATIAALYEELHPETRVGAHNRSHNQGRQLGGSTSENIVRFTTNTAARIGKSERAVRQRDHPCRHGTQGHCAVEAAQTSARRLRRCPGNHA